jgi:hypothetical protein
MLPARRNGCKEFADCVRVGVPVTLLTLALGAFWIHFVRY